MGRIAGCPMFSRSSRNVGFHGDIPPAAEKTFDFHTHLVTSNLALRHKSVHHSRGKSSLEKSDDNGPNSFVVKILTSNSFALKILRTLFANPAPSKTSRGRGGGGVLTCK
jgi:hypothetical protein